MVKDAEGNYPGPQNTPEDSKVNLQHMNDYDYHGRFTRDKVLRAVQLIRDQEAEVRADIERIAERERQASEAEMLALRPWVEMATPIMPRLLESVKRFCTHDIDLIHNSIQLEEFLIGGSYAAMIVQRAVTEILEANNDGYENVNLMENDIDVYYGTWNNEDGRELLNVLMSEISYVDVDGIDKPVNTVKCKNLSAKAFLSSNDVNVTACCLDMNYNNPDDVITMHVSPHFWQFIFSPKADRVVRPVKAISVLGARTAVRIAYKAFQMSQNYHWNGIDPCSGTLAKSHKEKIDSMSVWENTPFIDFKVLSKRTHFLLERKNKKMSCTQCGTGRANIHCAYKMCVKCCAVHVVGGNNEACNIPTHKKRASEKIANDGIDDNVDDGEGEGRVNEDEGPGNNAADVEGEGQGL